jgi:hypothetical protein
MTGGRRRVLVLAAAALMLVAWCAFASGFARSTVGAWVVWAVSATAVIATSVLFGRGSRGRRLGWQLASPAPASAQAAAGSKRLAALWPWLVLAGAIALWEFLGIDTGPQQPHLTLSAITGSYRSLDAATLCFWMAVGVGYGAARARRPQPPEASTDPSPGGLAATAGPLGGHHLLLSPLGLLLPASRTAGVAFWLAVFAAMLIVETWAQRSGGRVATAEQVVWQVNSWRLGNVVVVVGWLFAGWHLFAH